MRRRRFLVGRIFRWMESRAASAYSLVSEAIWLVHGSELEIESGEVLLQLIPAAMHLRALVVAIDEAIPENDEAAACEAVLRVATRSRPRLEFDPDARAYVTTVLAAAQRDVDRLHEAIVRFRERGKVAASVRAVSDHLGRAIEACARPSGPERVGS